MELCHGRAGGKGRALHQRAVGMEQPAQGSGHGPKLPEFKKCLDSTLRCRVQILGGAVWSHLDSMILVDPSSLGYSK